MRRLSWLVALFLAVVASHAAAAPTSLRSDVQIRKLLAAGTTAPHLVRVQRDLRDNQLYIMKEDGSVYRLNIAAGASSSSLSQVVAGTDYSSTISSAQGFAIGPDGTFYIVVNTTSADASTTKATIFKGVPSGAARAWSVLAATASYPRSKTAFDHVFNGIVVSPAGDRIYVNSGSRTDHGEVQDAGGVFPGLRETGLTAAIFELPANGINLQLPNDRAALKAAGYVFAEGTRNSFDLAFAPNGDLLASENGPDRAMPDELNWLRRGGHFGFPWNIGGLDNPQQFASYNPASDRLLDSRFIAVQLGYYRNDPTFPPSPGNLLAPIANFGPDADSFLDPATGSIRDASSALVALSTFTAHRSPLGLVFVDDASVSSAFRGHAFVLSFTAGDASGNSVAGPFADPSQDLLDLNLSKTSETYTARATRIVGGFSNPIDDAAVGSRIYVIEYGGDQGVYEVTLPGPGQASDQVVTPTFDPASGTFSSAQWIAITSATQGAAIQYTGDGSSPACSTTTCGSAAEYSGATLSCPAGQTIREISFASYGTPQGSCGAFALGSCHASNSQASVAAACVGKNTCTVSASNSVFGDPCSGTTKKLVIQAQCGGRGATYTAPLALSSSQTWKAIACKTGMSDSAVSSASYIIAETQVAAPVFTPAPGAYSSTQTVSMATPTAGATIRFTADNSTPSCVAGSGSNVCGTGAEFTSVTVSCPNGTTISSIPFASYGLPQGACGSFTTGSCHAASSAATVSSACVGKSTCTVAARNATFGDPCPGTNKRLAMQAQCGQNPSTVFSTPVVVSRSQTLKAVACKTGLSDSTSTSGSYTIAGSSTVAQSASLLLEEPASSLETEQPSEDAMDL